MRIPPVVTDPGVSSKLKLRQEVKVFKDAVLYKMQAVVRQVQLTEVQEPEQGSCRCAKHILSICFFLLSV